MNSKEQARVVDLQRRQEEITKGHDRLGDILKSCRGASQKHLTAMVSALFENVDDALFELAERAGSTDAQQMFFEGMREVRKKRQRLERSFLEHVRDGFSNFAAGKIPQARSMPGSTAPQDDNGDEGGGLKLSLVDDHELEQSLALSSMVSKVENRLARPLFALNQRFSVLIGGSKLESVSNPIGPALLADAFGNAIAELDTALEVRLIVLKLFERYVLSKLDFVYEELNALLVQAGVLPQLRQSVAHGVPGSRSGRPPPSAASPAHAHAPQSPAADGGYDDGQGAYSTPSDVQAEILGTLQALLSQRRPVGYGHVGPPPSAASMLRTEDLVGALGSIQNEFVQGWSQGIAPGGVTLSPEQMKQLLLKQTTNSGTSGEREHVKRDDEDTIELVAMLFEYIAKDRNIPALIQALLGRLQIPYLKVALLDRHLFAQKAHPARRLLDELAQISVGWTEEADRDGRVLGKIREVVESVLNDFASDVEIFKSLFEDLQRFAQGQRKRAEIAEQRAAEATRGKEKLLAARRAAGDAIEQRLNDVTVPPVVHSILTRPWANVLVLLHLRQGEDSEEYSDALRFVDDLIWSSQAKTREEDRVKLRGMLPELGKSLRKGLGLVAYQESDIKQVLADLTGFYRGLIDPRRASEQANADNNGVTLSESESAAADAEGGFEIVSRRDPAAKPPTPPPPHLDLPAIDAFRTELKEDESIKIKDDFLKVAKSLYVGAWLQFTDREGNVERAKLSWISPISSKYLFVNRRGLKVADKNVFELAADLRDGRAETLESVPLFDRAMDAIVERLKANPEDDLAKKQLAETKEAAAKDAPASAAKAEASAPPTPEAKDSGTKD